MNHLAHFFLSFRNEDLILGNWLADFIDQKEVAHYSTDIQKGIALHRKIDSFADAHIGIKKSIERLRPFSGRYAKVLIDIFNDHSLSKNWMLFSPNESIRDFSFFIYEIIEKRQNDLAKPLFERTQKMIAADWLMGYDDRTGMEYVIRRFEERMIGNAFYKKEKVDAHAALDYFLFNQIFFDENFKPFFSEMISAMQPFGLQNLKE